MSKKTIFLLGVLLVLLWVVNVSADTIPGGDVYGTWYQANSPYYITGNITVPADSSLFIQPGVEVIFQGYYTFTVNGFLQAIGTAVDSIHFTYSTDWMGMWFINAPDSSHLEYCTLEALLAPFGLIDCYNSNPVITRCRVSNNATIYDAAAGINLVNSSSPNISYCTISGNDGYLGGGIGCGNGCAPFISYCNITGNKNSYNYSVG